MPIPVAPGHLFSQHSLNTYLRCPRRYWLKYVERQPWPAREGAEGEGASRDKEHLRRGAVFHDWLVRRQLGVPMESVVAACGDPELQRWWYAFEALDLAALPCDIREAELPVVVPVGDYALYARFDLLAVDRGGRAVIVDWKTLPVMPSLRTLRERVQTRVYLFALVSAGEVLAGERIAAEDSAMWYWFVENPHELVPVSYDSGTFAADRDWIVGLVDEIAGASRASCLRTDDARQCRRCNYRTLCHREGTSDEAVPENAHGLQSWLDEDLADEIDIVNAPALEY